MGFDAPESARGNTGRSGAYRRGRPRAPTGGKPCENPSAQRAEKIGLRNPPARITRPSVYRSTLKAAPIPSVPISAKVVIAENTVPGHCEPCLSHASEGAIVAARHRIRRDRIGGPGRHRVGGKPCQGPLPHEYITSGGTKCTRGVPAAVNAIEDGPASPEKLTPDAQFNAALAHFHRAVMAKDAGSLKLLVRPEFQRIAQEGGPRAKDAAAYVSSAIPIALRGMTPWPQIRCGGEPDRETALQLSSFVDCACWMRPNHNGFSFLGRSFLRRLDKRAWTTGWPCFL